MENDAGDSTIRKGMCNEEECDDTGKGKIRRIDIPQQSNCPERSEGYEGNWEIIMPPSGISVVLPDIEYKCEFVDVPMNVPAPYVADFTPTGVVSAATANTLLRHIAGLSALAHQHSVQARQSLISMKQTQDMLLAERDCEILRLKKEVMRKEVIILMRDMARSVEEKFIPPALCLEGKDEFSRDRQHGVIGRDLSRATIGAMVVKDICPRNEDMQNNEVERGTDDFIQHTGFTTDSDTPTETEDWLSGDGSHIDACIDVKADAQSHVRGEGGVDSHSQGCCNSTGITSIVSVTSCGTGSI